MPLKLAHFINGVPLPEREKANNCSKSAIVEISSNFCKLLHDVSGHISVCISRLVIVSILHCL